MGLLVSSTRGSNTISYTYNQYGHVSEETRTVSGLGTRTFQYTYGSNGQLSNVLYPGTVNVGYQYDSYGNRSKVTVGGTTVWQMTNITAQNSAITTTAQLGSSLNTTVVTDLAGRMTVKSLSVGNTAPIRTMTFTYNAATGNMTGRIGMFPVSEHFAYDDLDRLTGIQYGGGSAHDISYAPNGNITTQTDIGRYYYEGGKPHAVTSVDNTRGRIPTSQLDTQYNVFGKISTILDYGDDEYRMVFTYGPDNERWRTRLYKDYSSLKRTTYYLGDYEEIVEGGITRRLYYIGDDVLYKKQTNQPDSIFYLFTDHLGSVVSIVDQSGNEEFSATYDAWGNQTVTRNDIKFHRGYTGHEMLPEFRLINMNGRLYDPQIGRFLSTDNFVQEPWNSQNFNRYSYCLNNPLKYTDPSGDVFIVDDIAAAIIIGVVVGGAINLGIKAYNGQIHGFKDGLAAFGIGAAAGALAAVTGGAATAAIEGTTVGASIISGMVSAAYSVPFQSMCNSMYFGDPMISGEEYIWSVVGSGLASGAITLGGNVLSGRKPWTGELKANKIQKLDLQPFEPAPIETNKSVQTERIESPDILIHYTNEEGYRGIIESQQIKPSVGIKKARYGEGVYLTDLNSADLTQGQISRRLYGVPWNGRKVQYFIKIDVKGLDVIKNAPFNYMIPTNKPLFINGRIVDQGATIFKIEF